MGGSGVRLLAVLLRLPSLSLIVVLFAASLMFVDRRQHQYKYVFVLPANIQFQGDCCLHTNSPLP